MKKSSTLILCLAILPMFAACDDRLTVTDPEFDQTELSEISNLNKVAFDLFDNTIVTDNDKSVVISPISITLALGMEANARSINTQAILEMYGLGDVKEANELYNKIINGYLYKRNGITSALSNATFNNSNFSGSSDANAVLKEYYYADAYLYDFNKSDEVSKKIVSWAKQKTNDMIDLGQVAVDNDAERILVNAIYFKGNWKFQFQESNTSQKTFTLNDGNQIQLPTMRQTYTGYYSSTDKFESADMFYGTDMRYAMQVILPKEGGKIDSEEWKKLKNWNQKEITIEMPKFETSFSYVPQIDNVLDSDILHAARIIVDEEGAKAAAVTVDGELGMSPAEPLEFKVNKPFYYVIYDTKTDLILFIGYYSGK